MKKLLSLMLVVIALAVTGCGKEGPMGPKGDTGVAGEPGAPGIVDQVTVVANIVPVTYSGGQAIDCPTIIVDMAGGNISTVVVYAGRSGDSQLMALPGALPDTANPTITDLAYSVSSGKVIVTWSQRGILQAPAPFDVYVTVVNR